MISEQRLKSCSRDGKLCAHDDAQKKPWQPEIKDQAVITGNFRVLAHEHAQQIAAQPIQRNVNSAKLQRNNHHAKKNGSEYRALQKKPAEREWSHQFFSTGADTLDAWFFSLNTSG